MGRHTNRLREVLKQIPTSPKGFTPEIASMCLTSLGQGALQIISELEEANEDLEKEVERLTMLMVEAGVAPPWSPTQG